jgi:aryl-alcohol dehydrogenase-like predicted oxidoreductase
LETLNREGLIGAWGVSTHDLTVAQRAVQLERLTVLQVPLEPAWLAAAGDLFEQCRQRGIAVVGNRVFSRLANRSPTEASQDDGLRQIAQCLDVALRLPAVRIALCGTTNVAHLAANVEAMRLLIREVPA